MNRLGELGLTELAGMLTWAPEMMLQKAAAQALAIAEVQFVDERKAKSAHEEREAVEGAAA